MVVELKILLNFIVVIMTIIQFNYFCFLVLVFYVDYLCQKIVYVCWLHFQHRRCSYIANVQGDKHCEYTIKKPDE